MVETIYIIGGIILLILFIIYFLIYNNFISTINYVKNSWSGIDVQLKKRCDLVPNLISAVKGYMKHEKNILENITKARTSILNSNGDVKNSSKNNNVLSNGLKSIFAVAENYPDLKASNNFLDLQNKLSELEDQISASRRIYNSNVQILNTKIQSIPTNIIAKIHNFQEYDFFEIDENEKITPKVKFK